MAFISANHTPKLTHGHLQYQIFTLANNVVYTFNSKHDKPKQS